MLEALRDEAAAVGEFNVLEFFADLDTRFFPITDDDRERAFDAGAPI